MKVLHVITSLRTGGAERLVVDLTRHMRRAGIETDIAVFDGTEQPLFAKAVSNGLHPIVLGRGLKDIYNPLHILRLRKLLGSYDIVHSHNYSAQLFTAVAKSLTKSHTLLVTTEHNTSTRRDNSGLWHTIDRCMYRRYAIVFCCSEAVRTACLTKFGLSSANSLFVTVPNGIDLAPFLALPSGPRNNDRKNILMVAAFRPQKDHITALRALSLLPENVRMTFAGEGETFGSVRHECHRLGLDSRVTFAGNVADIPSLYIKADAALLSTRHEGLSLSSLEAMASGTPFVSTDVPGITENVGDGAMLVPPSDPQALADALWRVISDTELAHSLAERGRYQARKFDIINTVNLYLSHYQNLLAI